eukprot:CAMPEP_0178639302 /NCGR_PEP_ID=MMETSP0698-20121128/15388_1 /TAXON_ID=265572 /ORGANISM="Extubocellulus spinifer, Strain CCMP396" /LENGTH=540 /DNA_ID=CAMNT_0020279621 /DNA_START=216 /DNA_END=1838 /DNA_ORIENTATION=-
MVAELPQCKAVLYGMAGNGYLYKVNPDTGKTTMIGDGAQRCSQTSGIAYDPTTSTMYGYSDSGFSDPDNIFVVDVTTGECSDPVTITSTERPTGIKEEYLDDLGDGTIAPRFGLLDMTFNSKGELFMLYTGYAEDYGRLYFARLDKATGRMTSIGGEFTNVRPHQGAAVMMDFDDADNLHMFIHQEEADNEEYSYLKHYVIDTPTADLTLLSNPAVSGRTALSYSGAVRPGTCEFYNIGGADYYNKVLEPIDMLENEFIEDRKANTDFLISLAFTDARTLTSSCARVDDSPSNDALLLTEKCGEPLLAASFLGECNWQENDGVPCMYPSNLWNSENRNKKGSDWVFCDNVCRCTAAGYPEVDSELKMTINTRCIGWVIPQRDRRCLGGYDDWPGPESSTMACRTITQYDGVYFVNNCCGPAVEIRVDDFPPEYKCEPYSNGYRCSKESGAAGAGAIGAGSSNARTCSDVQSDRTMWRAKLRKAQNSVKMLKAGRPIPETAAEIIVYERRFGKANRRRRRAIKKLKALGAELSECRKLFAL